MNGFFHIFIALLCGFIYIKTIQGEMLKCSPGKDILFERPFCPEEFDNCKFRTQKGEYVIRRRTKYVENYGKFKMTENKTHVILRECNEDDEGKYLWICGGTCNISKEFHLEVEITLECVVGGEVSFKCHCCSHGLGKCRFMKYNGDVFMRHGSMRVDTKHKFKDNLTYITLQKCKETDSGNYVWICGNNCSHEHFHLKVYKKAPEQVICQIGGEVAFESPRPDDFKNCTFGRLGEDNYIFWKGDALIDYSKYNLDALGKVILRNCSEADLGTYEWSCGDCRDVQELVVQQRQSQSINQIQDNPYHTSSAASHRFTTQIVLRAITLFLLDVHSCLRSFIHSLTER